MKKIQLESLNISGGLSQHLINKVVHLYKDEAKAEAKGKVVRAAALNSLISSYEEKAEAKGLFIEPNGSVVPFTGP